MSEHPCRRAPRLVQRVILRALPRRAAEALESESRNWVLHCPHCHCESSVWDRGGIRWGARGKPRRLLKCEACDKLGWHVLSREVLATPRA